MNVGLVRDTTAPTLPFMWQRLPSDRDKLNDGRRMDLFSKETKDYQMGHFTLNVYLSHSCNNLWVKMDDLGLDPQPYGSLGS
jgi:hypothetical protein